MFFGKSKMLLQLNCLWQHQQQNRSRCQYCVGHSIWRCNFCQQDTVLPTTTIQNAGSATRRMLTT